MQMVDTNQQLWQELDVDRKVEKFQEYLPILNWKIFLYIHMRTYIMYVRT